MKNRSIKKSIVSVLALYVLSILCSGCVQTDINETSTSNPPLAAKIFGFNFGPFMDGQGPDTGSVISEEQFRERLSFISPYVHWIRTYGSADGGLANAGKTAHAAGIKIAQGCWLSNDRTANTDEINNLIQAANAGYVDIAIVGSESLYRGDLTESELAGYIDMVKRQIPDNVPVTTAEPADVWLRHPALLEAVDMVFYNFYVYYKEIAVSDCKTEFDSTYKTMTVFAQGKEVVISETGFPSGGSSKGAAVPSAENAAEHFVDFVRWANSKNVKYFYFEAFDEKWKVRNEGDIGGHWGVFDADGKLKSGMIEAFNTGGATR